ncbi:hypothetical protein PPACK8108_LOCUS3563 [Phakopsora pachyrhizi]|uniref:Glucose-methanol-choline oxidoreductase N-terminal domain-containing protein n=1 Tax=Phakopsora pachyrhizi TaxID=170000 RepID=A0AAV0ALG4_PHAPC|nr:hypothetical protein PPACK8108_LOCUS3563 [Phakopsora pachyrhizi]
MVVSKIVISIFIFISFSWCESSLVNVTESFDFVVIGGGTAGLTIASRLSEDPLVSVLVLEAGGDGTNNIGIKIPGLIGTTLATEVDWKYSTLPQKGANGRQIYYPLGKVLGGTSSINFIISTKASKDDYESIARLGNPGWGWLDFDHASKRSEEYIKPQDGSKTPYDPHAHGHHGPVKNSYPRYIPPQFYSYFSAARALKGSSPRIDTFSGYIDGAHVFPSAIDENLNRVTSASAYYFPIKSRKNLLVKTNCIVSRLIHQKAKSQNLSIRGVEYREEDENYSKRVTVKKEVILSAGSIGTPAILERSGIGDIKLLRKLRIRVAVNLPGVGSQLMDHPAVLGTYRLRSGIVSSDDIQRNATFAAEQFSLHESGRPGLLSHALSILDYSSLSDIVNDEELQEGLRLLKYETNQTSIEQFEATVERIKYGTPVEFLLINGFFESDLKANPNTSYITIATTLQYPLSRGSTHISSQNPEAQPNIDPKLLAHPFDNWLMIKAAKHARKIMSQSDFKDFILGEQFPGPSVKTDEDWLKSVRERVRTEYHPMGTGSMISEKLSGVVNPKLIVHGTKNLRIVDASIFPIPIAAHPAFTIYSIAEKASELIKDQYYKIHSK